MGDGGQSWGRYPGRNFLSHKINRRMATKQGCGKDNTALRESGKRVLPFPWTGYFGCPKFAPGFGQVSRRGGGEAPQPSLALALSTSLHRKGEASSKVRLWELTLGTGMPPPRTERGLWIQLETVPVRRPQTEPGPFCQMFSQPTSAQVCVLGGQRHRGVKRGRDPGEQRPGWSPSPCTGRSKLPSGDTPGVQGGQRDCPLDGPSTRAECTGTGPRHPEALV